MENTYNVNLMFQIYFFLTVIHVQGPLTLKRTCTRSWLTGDNIGKYVVVCIIWEQNKTTKYFKKPYIINLVSIISLL